MSSGAQYMICTVQLDEKKSKKYASLIDSTGKQFWVNIIADWPVTGKWVGNIVHLQKRV